MVRTSDFDKFTSQRRQRAWTRRVNLAVCAGLLGTVLTGCPRRFDPRADEIHSPSREAEADYLRARQLLLDGRPAEAEQALARFATQYTEDPLQPQVAVLRARAALQLGQPARARDLARPFSTPAGATTAASQASSERARFVLGLAHYRLGEFAAARELLAPYADQIVDSDDGTELHAVLADLLRRDGQVAAALREYDRFYHGRGTSPVEQAYVREQVRHLVPGLLPDEQVRVRARFELQPTAAPSSAGRAPVLGIVVPLRGKDRALGDRVLRGALFGAGVLDGGGAGLAEVRVRDSGSTPEQAAEAVRELAQEGVVGLIGSPSRGPQAESILTEAERLGLPALDLRPGVEQGGRAGAAFNLVPGNAARVRALVQHALRRGVRSIAVLAPATPYGKAMTDVVAGEVAGKPVRLLAQLSFPEGTTSFAQQAKELLAARPEALVLPVAVAQLELISAQLATTGVIATQDVRTRTRGEAPPVGLVLTTADGMGERLLRNAGRYLQGAVLAPLSIGAVSSDDPGLSGPAERFQKALGEEPGALDALGLDATGVLLRACGTGTCSPEQVARALPAMQLSGATGTVQFNASGQRAGVPLLFRVEGSVLRIVRPIIS